MRDFMHGGTVALSSKRCFEGCADTYKSQLDQLDLAKQNFDSCEKGCKKAVSAPVSHVMPSNAHANAPVQTSLDSCLTDCVTNNGCKTKSTSVERSSCASLCVTKCKPQH